MTTYEKIRQNPAVKIYIQRADESLAALGYTEHSFAHVTKAAESVKYILQTMGYDEHAVEMGMIAAYLHDIGNLINRSEHAQSGAIMAFRILDEMGMPAEDVATIVTAIGNHDEGTGVPVNAIAAALILADKSDEQTFDIHDRVNYSVEKADLSIDEEKKQIRLTLTVDTRYGSVMDYFEIFLGRMIMCRKAADKLGLQFRLEINGQSLI